MKEFVFRGYGVQKQTYSYGVCITAQEMAEHMDISVEEVEAMTEEDIMAFMRKNLDIISDMVYSNSDNVIDIDWPYDPEYKCDDDEYFELEVEE